MNKVFKVVWSATKNAYVVTSELAKSHQKTATTIVAAILLSASLGGGIASASTPADWYRTDLIGSQKWLTPGQGSQAVEQQPIDLHQQDQQDQQQWQQQQQWDQQSQKQGSGKIIVDLTNIKNQVNQNTYNISVLKGNVNCLNSKFYCLADKVSKNSLAINNLNIKVDTLNNSVKNIENKVTNNVTKNVINNVTNNVINQVNNTVNAKIDVKIEENNKNIINQVNNNIKKEIQNNNTTIINQVNQNIDKTINNKIENNNRLIVK